MRFITIKNQKNEIIAINTDSIGHVEFWSDSMHSCAVIYSNGKAITTKFTSIEAAVDYIQRAASMSMGVS
tara:strand:- start:1032 stop:1241 length:210 start_codon:yes stop_codon:yes gene_type:complete